ncbi:FAD-dependent oxidoreductase [Chloroflexi bacterium TSY]|nr:FAD-dependent oxidoreductase [Chloroflexi bacterium TSY]
MIQTNTLPSESRHHHESTVCVVGGGPAGVVLSYLLARQGISVTLLEAQKDFDRDFRCDTIHAAIMENMDQLGLAARLLELPHYKMRQLSLRDAKTNGQGIKIVDFSRLKSKFPYVTMMAQPIFLNFMVEEAKQFPGFQIIMGASAQKLIQDNDGKIQGVQYRKNREWGAVHAHLTIAADGRSSKIRKLAGFEPIPITEPMDVLWFRLSKEEDDRRQGLGGLTGGGRLPFILLERMDHWQCGLVVPNGGYQVLRKQGIGAFRELLVEHAPQLKERIGREINEWRDIAWLNVTGSRLEQWHLPGLLLIGDAAHVMTPIGGVGINYAIQDAIVAANVLTEPLNTGQVTQAHLANIQAQREWPTKFIQNLQAAAQRRIVKPGLLMDEEFVVPWFMRLVPHISLLCALPARMVGYDVRRVSVQGI